jgi:hypothetical protein
MNWTIGTYVIPIANWKKIIWIPELEKFCAITDGTTGLYQVITSTDGLNWTIATSGISSGKSWWDIEWAPEISKICVTSKNTYVMTSSNGLSWTSSNILTSYWIKIITWSPELKLFCAIFYNFNDIYYISGTSIDGLTWTYGSQITNETVVSIAWCSAFNKFVLITTNSSIYTSINGIVWNKINQTFSYSDSWNCKWINELKIVFFIGSEKCIYSSDPNLLLWNTITDNSKLPLITFESQGCVSWSSELGILLAVGDEKFYISSPKYQFPTAKNLFDSCYNSIDNSGNWTFGKNVNIQGDLYINNTPYVSPSTLSYDGTAVVLTTSGTNYQIGATDPLDKGTWIINYTAQFDVMTSLTSTQYIVGVATSSAITPTLAIQSSSASMNYNAQNKALIVSGSCIVVNNATTKYYLNSSFVFSQGSIKSNTSTKITATRIS